MQDQFDREKPSEQIEECHEEMCVLSVDGTQILPYAELTEQMKRAESGKKLRFASNRVGWATSVLFAVWIALVLGVSAVVYAVDLRGGGGTEFYNKYILIINEVTLAVAVAVAMAMLISVPKENLCREKISTGRFLKILAMCFGATYVGNLISTMWLVVWNIVTGNSVGNQVASLLYGMNPLLMFVSVSVLAPILEELFFRKFLIDRLRLFGEVPAILLSAFLFALFHHSPSQLIYTFAMGILIGYFYCRTGNYWLTVLIHSLLNTISGVIPSLLFPKLTECIEKIMNVNNALSEGVNPNILVEELIFVFQVLGLSILYIGLLFVVNITGVILLILSFKNYKERKGEYSLSFKESVKTVFKTPGIIVCTVLLGAITVISLFS